MSIEARSPPPQFAFRLKRALGGRAGWSGFALQIAFVLILVWIGYEIFVNARTNLEHQRIASGFGCGRKPNLSSTGNSVSSARP